jgi:hypothetical protein
MIEVLALVLTGLGLTASIIYYANILNNANKTRELQLKTQQQAEETRQAQLFMQLYNRLMSDLDGLEADTVVMTPISNFAELKHKQETDPNFKQIFIKLIQFFEVVGVLVKLGYINIDIIALTWTSITQSFWENVVGPTIEEQREYYNYDGIWAETEYLYNELMKYRKEHPDT